MKRKFIFWLVLVSFIFNIAAPYALRAEVAFPGSQFHLINTTAPFSPLTIKGLKLYSNDPFKFDFMIDEGNTAYSDTQLKTEAQKLIEYFLVSLTVPEKDLWVNLSPYEKQRIIPEELSRTGMGMDMLNQDYVLKQLASSLTYPDSEMGKAFWDKVRARAKALYGNDNVAVNNFNRIWIVPQKAVVYTDKDKAYVGEATLKVMMEEDYLAAQKNNPLKTSDISTQIMREVIIPVIEEEVNNGKNFTQLRQMYKALILAAWFKKHLKDSIVSQLYADQNKVHGIDTSNPNAKEKIYNQYLQACKDGAYNYIKRERISYNKITKRQYFSGGLGLVVNTVLQDHSADTLSAAQRAVVEANDGVVTTQLKDVDAPGATKSDALPAGSQRHEKNIDGIIHGLYINEGINGRRVIYVNHDDIERYMGDFNDLFDIQTVEQVRRFLAGHEALHALLDHLRSKGVDLTTIDTEAEEDLADTFGIALALGVTEVEGILLKELADLGKLANLDLVAIIKTRPQTLEALLEKLGVSVDIEIKTPAEMAKIKEQMDNQPGATIKPMFSEVLMVAGGAVAVWEGVSIARELIERIRWNKADKIANKMSDEFVKDPVKFCNSHSPATIEIAVDRTRGRYARNNTIFVKLIQCIDELAPHVSKKGVATLVQVGGADAILQHSGRWLPYVEGVDANSIITWAIQSYPWGVETIDTWAPYVDQEKMSSVIMDIVKNSFLYNSGYYNGGKLSGAWIPYCDKEEVTHLFLATTINSPWLAEEFWDKLASSLDISQLAQIRDALARAHEALARDVSASIAAHSKDAEGWKSVESWERWAYKHGYYDKPKTIYGQIHGLFVVEANGRRVIYVNHNDLVDYAADFQAELGRGVTMEQVRRFLDGHETFHALLDYARAKGVDLKEINGLEEEELADVFGYAFAFGSVNLPADLHDALISLGKKININLIAVLESNPSGLEELLNRFGLTVDVEIATPAEMAKIKETSGAAGHTVKTMAVDIDRRQALAQILLVAGTSAAIGAGSAYMYFKEDVYPGVFSSESIDNVHGTLETVPVRFDSGKKGVTYIYGKRHPSMLLINSIKNKFFNPIALRMPPDPQRYQAALRSMLGDKSVLEEMRYLHGYLERIKQIAKEKNVSAIGIEGVPFGAISIDKLSGMYNDILQILVYEGVPNSSSIADDMFLLFYSEPAYLLLKGELGECKLFGAEDSSLLDETNRVMGVYGRTFTEFSRLCAQQGLRDANVILVEKINEMDNSHVTYVNATQLSELISPFSSSPQIQHMAEEIVNLVCRANEMQIRRDKGIVTNIHKLDQALDISKRAVLLPVGDSHRVPLRELLLAHNKADLARPKVIDGIIHGLYVNEGITGRRVIYVNHNEIAGYLEHFERDMDIKGVNEEQVRRYIDGHETLHALLDHLRRKGVDLRKIDAQAEEDLADTFGIAFALGISEVDGLFLDELVTLGELANLDLVEIVKTSPRTLEALLEKLGVSVDIEIKTPDEMAQIKKTAEASGHTVKPMVLETAAILGGLTLIAGATEYIIFANRTAAFLENPEKFCTTNSRRVVRDFIKKTIARSLRYKGNNFEKKYRVEKLVVKLLDFVDLWKHNFSRDEFYAEMAKLVRNAIRIADRDATTGSWVTDHLLNSFNEWQVCFSKGEAAQFMEVTFSKVTASTILNFLDVFSAYIAPEKIKAYLREELDRFLSGETYIAYRAILDNETKWVPYVEPCKVGTIIAHATDLEAEVSKLLSDSSDSSSGKKDDDYGPTPGYGSGLKIVANVIRGLFVAQTDGTQFIYVNYNDLESQFKYFAKELGILLPEVTVEKVKKFIDGHETFHALMHKLRSEGMKLRAIDKNEEERLADIFGKAFALGYANVNRTTREELAAISQRIDIDLASLLVRKNSNLEFLLEKLGISVTVEAKTHDELEVIRVGAKAAGHDVRPMSVKRDVGGINYQQGLNIEEKGKGIEYNIGANTGMFDPKNFRGFTFQILSIKRKKFGTVQG